MHTYFSTALVAMSLVSSVLAAPRPFYKDVEPTPVHWTPANLINPTSFPALTNDADIRSLEILAHGTLPNGPPPPPGGFSSEGITNLQLIMLNEFFEAAFFASLLENVTNKVAGYEIDNDVERIYIQNALTAIAAQEQLHGIGAAKNLLSQSATTITPCTYRFPTTNFADAIEFASLFTELVLGTLQDASQIFAVNKDSPAVRLVASVIGQEGQQDGFFRLLSGGRKVPSQLPFLSTSTRDFAFSALEQNVLVACPNDGVLKAKLKLFGVLELVAPAVILAHDQTLQFRFDINSLAQSANVVDPGSDFTAFGRSFSPATNWAADASVVYLNQLNTPVVVPLRDVSVDASLVSFTADFPYTANLMNGLTVVSVVNGSGPFADPAAVANSALFGPALFSIR